MKRITKNSILFFILTVAQLTASASNLDTFFESLFSKLSQKEVYILKQSNSYKNSFGILKTNYTVENSRVKDPSFILTNIGETMNKLKNSIEESKLEKINHHVLKKRSLNRYLELQKETGIAFYTLCYQEEVGDSGTNTCEIVEYSQAVQSEITELFNFENLHDITPEQMELHELNAIRIASKIIEDNSFLKDDKGGWSGNAKKSMKGKTALTRCGNETFTYLYFLSDLYDQGVIKHLNVYKSGYVLRSAWFRAEHQAVRIDGLYSKNSYVIDSWLDHGGEMARILKLEDWKKKKDKRNIVPGSRDF
jgi:hypothetical protein